MISAIFVDRPRLAVVIAVVITIAGLLALTRIPVAQFPDIVPPQVGVTATYPGASAAAARARSVAWAHVSSGSLARMRVAALTSSIVPHHRECPEHVGPARPARGSPGRLACGHPRQRHGRRSVSPPGDEQHGLLPDGDDPRRRLPLDDRAALPGQRGPVSRDRPAQPRAPHGGRPAVHRSVGGLDGMGAAAARKPRPGACGLVRPVRSGRSGGEPAWRASCQRPAASRTVAA